MQRKQNRLLIPPEQQTGEGRVSDYSRRGFLASVGASTFVMWLSGCGGGSGSSGGSKSLGGIGRTKVTGATKDQVNQFSAASEQIGNIWEGTSGALSDLQAFGTSSKAARRSVGGTNVMFQAVWFSLQGLKSGYERLLNGLLAEDDQGTVAETVSANSNLDANSTLVNPQWLAAMMLQTYCAARVTGALIKIIQLAGFQQMQDWVAAQTTDTNTLIAYGILADTYNSWLDAIAKTLSIKPLTSLKLDVSSAVTVSSVTTQLAGISAFIDAIPFTAGLRVGGVANGVPDDAMLTGPATANFSLSFLGSLAQITLSTGPLPATFVQTVDSSTAAYNVATRLGATGLGATINTSAGSAAMAQTAADALVSNLMSTALPGASDAAATFIVQTAVGAYSLIAAVAQAILSDHSLVGAALDGATALGMLNAEINGINSGGTTAQVKILTSVLCDIQYLQSTYLVGGATTILRTIPVVNIPTSVETDQVNGLLQVTCNNVICYPLANAGWTGKPTDGTISLYRGIVSGLPSVTTGVARTINNVEVSGAGLFYDLLFRNNSTLKPDTLTSGEFIFCCSNFARLLRRSPGAVNAQISAITSAALLCSAPNFVPSKENGPLNLVTLPSLGGLTPITQLVPGVTVNVQ